MSVASRLIHDLETAIAVNPSGQVEHALWRVTDLFLAGADMLTDEQVELFDGVIARLALAIEARARAELAEMLAGVATAPRGVIRALAHDAIAVARPVLARSERLTDADLVTVAIAKGREHMLAIAERPTLAEPVTEVLVTRGDREVVHAVARNAGARFSTDTVMLLVDRSHTDDDLHGLLERRGDLPADAVRRLVDIAKERARRRLTQSIPATMPAHLQACLQSSVDGAVERSAERVRAIVAGALDYAAALDTIGAIEIGRPLDEADVAGFAAQGCIEETICAVAAVGGLSLEAAERLFTAADADLLLVVGKAQGWSFATLQALLALRDPDSLVPHHLKRLADVYETIAPKTAQQVTSFIRRQAGDQVSVRSKAR